MFYYLWVSLLRSAGIVNALVAATATVIDVHVTAGNALVCDAADVWAGSGAATVSHRRSTTAQYTPTVTSTEGTSPAVSVQANAIEAFWRKDHSAGLNA